MRTLKLTHKQIELLTYALGIAENTAMVQLKSIRENLMAVRDSNDSMKEAANAVFDLSCQFSDLSSSIKAGELDV